MNAKICLEIFWVAIFVVLAKAINITHAITNIFTINNIVFGIL